MPIIGSFPGEDEMSSNSHPLRVLPILFQVNCSISSFDVHISSPLLDALSKLGSKTKEKTKEYDELNFSPVAYSSSLYLSWCSASIQLDHFNVNINLDGGPEQSAVISICLTHSNIG